jgi:hypothetical protein
MSSSWAATAAFRSLRSVTVVDHCLPSAWNGLWNGALDNPSAASAVSAMTCAIGAASAHGARGRTSCKRQVSGSIPLTGSQVSGGKYPLCVSVRGTSGSGRGCLAALQLPSRTVAAESVCGSQESPSGADAGFMWISAVLVQIWILAAPLVVMEMIVRRRDRGALRLDHLHNRHYVSRRAR